MTLVEILLFLIFSVLVSSYFNYFSTSAKDKFETPEIMLMRWLLWILVSGCTVFIFFKTINFFI